MIYYKISTNLIVLMVYDGKKILLLYIKVSAIAKYTMNNGHLPGISDNVKVICKLKMELK
jgi:hypothetical protein